MPLISSPFPRKNDAVVRLVPDEVAGFLAYIQSQWVIAPPRARSPSFTRANS
jgi:hypothetical protein